MIRYLICLTAIVSLSSCVHQPIHQPSLTDQYIQTDALLQAISIVDETTVWVSGHQASFAKTTDGGQSWMLFQKGDEDSLQFRDVHAFDSSRILLMSAGPGSLSRIYEVRNGVVWRERFTMTDSLGFLDCLDFWDDQRGIAYGDAIDAYPYILLTENGGKTWFRADSTNMPKAGSGEGGFASSGTCVTTGEGGKAWIATAVGGNSRIIMTDDYGMSWSVVESPIIAGEHAGNTSVDFVDEQRGFVTGGDLVIQDEYTDNCAFTNDGGQTWELTNKPVTLGAFYGSSTVQLGDQNFTFVCGPNGLDFTSNEGQSWAQLDSANLWAVDVHTSGVGWVVGAGGAIKQIVLKQ